MKYILLLITILISTYCFSQKEIRYVDSLKKIINKGIPEGYGNSINKNQIRYIKACGSLADFYKSNNNIKKALHYYLLVAELGDGTDSKLGDNDIAIELRDKICLKVGNIYFTGKGIKKDLNKALIYHAKGLLENNWDKADYYSKLYFHNTNRIILIETKHYFTNDTSTTCTLNPFYFFRKISVNEISKALKEIKMISNRDSSLNCLLQIESGHIIPYSETGGAALSKFLESVKRIFIEEKIFNANKFSMNVDFNSLSCMYKSINLPCLEIKLSKTKLN
jgi:hypothetical protein